jgi:hypothetical protein
MKKRIVGLETEYAIRYSSFISEKQDNRVLYDLIIKVIPSFVKIADGTSILKWKQYFWKMGVLSATKASLIILIVVY